MNEVGHQYPALAADQQEARPGKGETGKDRKSCHVGIELLYLGAHRDPIRPRRFLKKLKLTRRIVHEPSMSVEASPSGLFSPTWYIRGSRRQAALSGVQPPTERHTFLRPWHTLRIAPRPGTGHGDNGVIGRSRRTRPRQGLEPPVPILIQ